MSGLEVLSLLLLTVTLESLSKVLEKEKALEEEVVVGGREHPRIASPLEKEKILEKEKALEEEVVVGGREHPRIASPLAE